MSFSRRSIGLATVVGLLVGGLASPSGAALKAGKVKKIVKRQIKKLVPPMIDAATIDQAVISPVTASVSDPNKPIFTAGPFTMSLDCSLDGSDVNLKLLARTTEENSVVNDGDRNIHGDLDPVDGDQPIADYTGDPPSSEAVSYYPYYQVASLRAPSGTHVWVQFDTATNYQGNHCYADGWFLDMGEQAPTSSLGKPDTLAGPAKLAAPVTAGKVKRIAKKQIKKLTPGIVDAATLGQGVLPTVTASASDPSKTVVTAGPFTISVDCDLGGSGNAFVELNLLVKTTEENSAVNSGNGSGSGDLDPADGNRVFSTYLGAVPGGAPDTLGMYDEAVSLRSPSGTHVFIQFDTVTNYRGSHCYVEGWFLDLGGTNPTSAKLAAAPADGSVLAPLTAGRVKRIARRQIKKLVPGMVDAGTIDMGTISAATAGIADSNKTVLTAGPFTASLDCGTFMGNVRLQLFMQSSEENAVASDGAGYLDGELEPSDGSVMFADHTGNPPGGEAANTASLFYEYATLRSPSGTHVYAQFDTLTNYQGNHCYADGWFLDLAG